MFVAPVSYFIFSLLIRVRSPTSNDSIIASAMQKSTAYSPGYVCCNALNTLPIYCLVELPQFALRSEFWQSEGIGSVCYSGSRCIESRFLGKVARRLPRRVRLYFPLHSR